MIRPSKRTGMFSTGTCSPRIGWWICPARSRPVCRHAATERPLRLVDGLAHEVLVDQRGAVVGAHLARARPARDRSPALRVLGPRSDGAHRHQEQEVGEGEVGQDAPGPEQALEVLELVGLEVGVARASSAGVGHGQPSSAPAGRPTGGPANGTGYGSRARYPCSASTPTAAEQRAQVVGPVGDVVEAVGVRRRGERDAAGRRSARAAAGPGTARPPACATRPRTPRPPCPTATAASAIRSHHSAGASGHAAGHLDQVGVGQHVARARGRQLLHGRGVRVPAGVDLARRPLGHRHRVVEVVEAPASRASGPSPAARRRGSRRAGRPRRPCGPGSSRPRGRSRRAARPPWPPARTST